MYLYPVQSGQISVWVTLVVAVLGIAGVIAGQLINAWREDRRWRRDTELERLRWERQKKRERAERQHDARMHWKEQRLDAYANWDAHATDWVFKWVRAMARGKVGSPLDLDAATELRTCLTDLRLAGSRVELLGSPAVVQRIKSIMRLVEDQWITVRRPDRADGIRSAHLGDAVDAELGWIVDDFRYDLGVSDQISKKEQEDRASTRARYEEFLKQS